MMYLGLTLTYASSFQMLRGAVIIFTGLMAIVILKRSLKATHWAGMVVVLMGLVLVGGAAFVGGGGGGAVAPNQVVGDIIIIAAQVVVAFQMVVEEKLNDMGQFPALKAVGFEGLFGCIYITGFVILFNHIDGEHHARAAPFRRPLTSATASWAGWARFGLAARQLPGTAALHAGLAVKNQASPPPAPPQVRAPGTTSRTRPTRLRRS